MSPYEAWTNTKLDVSHFCVFGCITYAHIPDHIERKLDNKSEKCLFIIYSYKSKSYTLYDTITKKFFVSKDVQFQEDKNWDDKMVGNFFPST
jgi:hypothetical protein